MLYYSTTGKGNAEGKCDRLWKITVRSEKEKDRILQSCHSDAHGEHQFHRKDQYKFDWVMVIIFGG